MSYHNGYPQISQGEAFVYFIQQIESGYIKIGYTVDVMARVAALRTSQPQTLVVRFLIRCSTTLCAMQLEAVLHRHYRAYRLGRNEWFDLAAVTWNEDDLVDFKDFVVNHIPKGTKVAFYTYDIETRHCGHSIQVIQKPMVISKWFLEGLTAEQERLKKKEMELSCWEYRHRMGMQLWWIMIAVVTLNELIWLLALFI